MFNRNRRLDPSQVEDRRGRSGTGRIVTLGGGGLGLIITIVYLLLGGNLTARPSRIPARRRPTQRQPTLAGSATCRRSASPGLTQ